MRLMLACLVVLSATSWSAAQQVEDKITVRVVGTLQTGVVAIGGETTGTTITAKNITWELEFGQHERLQRRAEELNGKKVVVEGSLEQKAGVEIAQRWIVTVTDLRPASAPAEERRQGAVEVTEKPETAQVDVQFENAVTRIAVRCARGIGRATLARSTPHGPLSLHVRLYLAGCESCKLSCGSTSVEWSVGQEGSRVVLHEASGERPLDASSPYWSPVCVVRPGDSDAASEAGETYYEIRVPDELLRDAERQITIEWIDFYRG